MTSTGGERLVRGTAAATWWSLLGLALVASGVFFVVDSGGHPLAWLALALFALVAAYFLVPLLVPGALSIRLDHDALRARTFLRRVEIAWDEVRLARVRRVAGDLVLRLDVGRDPDGDVTAVTVPLPVGADLAALHRFLARRLGRPRRR